MSGPTVSIVIPTYNRATLLPRALDSIIAQTHDDWEIVLVNDGSTDATEEVVSRFQARLGHRLTYLRQANGGSSRARNAGIDASRGRYVAFLDDDDMFLPHKLERQLALFDRCPELGFVYSDYAFIDPAGHRHESTYDAYGLAARQVRHRVVAPGLWVITEDLFRVLLRSYFVATIVGMVRRDVLGDTIRFPEGFRYAEEWLFYLQIARACPAGFVDEALCLHHHLPGSLSRTDVGRNNRELRKLLKRMLVIFDHEDRAARRIIHRNLAHTCRQLGYDGYRSGHYDRAVRYFAESLSHQPTRAALTAWVSAWWREKGGTRSLFRPPLANTNK